MSSASYLGPLGLDGYVKDFDEEGYEDATLLDDATLDMLTKEMKMKSGHARKLLKYLESQGILAIEEKAKVLDKPSSATYLEEIELARYAEAMDEEGYEEIENLKGVTAQNLIDEVKGMKRGHAKKIVRFVEEKLRPEEEPNKTSVKEEVPPNLPALQNVSSMAIFRSHSAMMSANAHAALVAKHMQKHPELKWHAFMSHMQAEGGDCVMAIDMHLSPRGWVLWTDQSPNADVTLEGMKNGVRESLVYVLYCTKSVFQRPFVRLELLEAVKQKKPILMLYEEDNRRAKFTFDAKTGVPPGFQSITAELLRNHCAIPWERRPHLRKATIELIETRIVETVTGSGVGLKPLNVSAEEIVAAEKCCFDNVKKEEKPKETVSNTTSETKSKKESATSEKKKESDENSLLTEDDSWKGNKTFDTEPNIVPSKNGMLISPVNAKGTRSKWQNACTGLYRATDQIVNGKCLYYHIGERRYLYYSDTYHNWLTTNDNSMFSKGMGYLRTRSKNISDPSDGLKIMELYDNSVWVDSGARVTSLSGGDLRIQMEKRAAEERSVKQLARGVLISGIVGKGTRKANQDKLNQKYFADLNSWRNGRYNLYIGEKSDSFLFYNNKYENWVITNKYDAFANGVGYARSGSVHSTNPANLTWEIYDTSWEKAPGATSTLLSTMESDTALKDRLRRRTVAKSKTEIVLKGFSYEYDGKYVQDPHLMIDGRTVYSKDGKKFVYYTTIYNNWLVTNARSNFIKGAGLFRTAGKTHDFYPPSTLTWEVYDYSLKKWVNRSGVTLTHVESAEE